MERKVPIIVLAGNLVSDGRTLGSQALERCETAADVYWHLAADDEGALIIISAGIDPVLGRAESQKLPLAEMMARQLVTMHGVRRGDIRTNTKVWGSRAEVHEALRFISESPDEFYSSGVVVSHRYHHLRLRIAIWKRSRKLGLKMVWKYISRRGPIKSVLHELYKVPVETLRPS